tara:strand:+ start:150 stop:2444 length:2295 start_codon:yes stop_codon:yes gene_type:complete
MTFSANMQRLRSAERANFQQAAGQRTNMANIVGERRIRETDDVINKLQGFSTSLQNYQKRKIKEDLAIGKQEQQKAELERAKTLTANQKRIAELEQAAKDKRILDEFESAKAQEFAFQKLKEDTLKLSGPSAYPDADRIAHLSPWQQVGFAKEKLRVFNETFPDKLEHAMANSTEMIQLENFQFSPAEIRDNNLALPMKEAAIQVMSDKIRKAAKIDQYSDEFLRYTGTDDAINKAEEAMYTKYTNRYNIEASINTRAKADLQFDSSPQNAADLYLWHLTVRNTIDAKTGNPLGNLGAWSHIDKHLIANGIKSGNSEYADKILNEPMPDSLAKELGVKQGTTFAQQWPKKAETIQSGIRKGIAERVKQLIKEAEADGDLIYLEMLKEIRDNGGISKQRQFEYMRRYDALGLTVPDKVKSWRTAMDAEEAEHDIKIKQRIAAQKGEITNNQLDEYNPAAAQKYRDQADKFEKKSIEAYGAQKQIKAALNETLEGMGFKNNEKSLIYEQAYEYAKSDYAEKYWRLIGLGYDEKRAADLAMNAQPGQVLDPDTKEPINDFSGVVWEIENKGRNSTYMNYGEAASEGLADDQKRSAYIIRHKEQMVRNPNLINNGTIGESYGAQQLQSIIDNIAAYGTWKGINMSKGALKYYTGLSRNRSVHEGGVFGLIDSQLKAVGHQGLYTGEDPEFSDNMINIQLAQNLKKAFNGEMEDPDGYKWTWGEALRALENGTIDGYLYAAHILEDSTGIDYDGYWTQDENVQFIWGAN